jgi:small subunit ribosomal protein S1
MNDLLAQSAFDKLKVGAIIPGTITEIRQNEVVVDIGGKSEGLIPANEFIDIGELQIGSSIEVLSKNSKTRTVTPSFPTIRPNKRKTGITSSPNSPRAPSRLAA